MYNKSNKPENVFFDEEKRVIEFSIGRPKKITGSRIASILGLNDYSTPFKAACEIAKLYKGDEPTKYTEAGEIVEPKIRNYVRINAEKLFKNSYFKTVPGIEDPIPKEKCYFEHFPNNEPFGGMVDGYVLENGKKAAILEIKSSKSRTTWFDENGNEIVPPTYVFQASLYAKLANLSKIVFAIGFLEDRDYDNPYDWVPNENNTVVRIVDPIDMTVPMQEAVEWYNKYILGGITPQWTNEDLELVEKLIQHGTIY